MGKSHKVFPQDDSTNGGRTTRDANLQIPERESESSSIVPASSTEGSPRDRRSLTSKPAEDDPSGPSKRSTRSFTGRRSSLATPGAEAGEDGHSGRSRQGNFSLIRRRSNLASLGAESIGKNQSASSSGKRRSSVTSSMRGETSRFARRRSGVGALANGVTNIAQSLTKMLDKQNDAINEKRQAQVAELVDKDVMVLNASQLAQIVDVAVDVIFMMETTTNVFTSYEDDTTGEEIKDLVKIRCNYFYGCSYQDEQTSWGPTDEIRASSLVKQYVDAVYFAILVTTANGVAPTTDIEKVFTALMQFIGIVINASIIGSAANLLSNLDKAEIARKDQMDSINDYLRFKKVPLALQDKIRQYYDYALTTRLRDPTESLFVDLPDRLKLSFKLNLQEDFIRKVPLFRVCSHAGVIAIIQCLRLVVVMPGEIIIRQGEVADEFYFIKSDQVSIRVLSDTFEIVPLDNLVEGSFFGGTSLLTGGEPQSAEHSRRSVQPTVCKSSLYGTAISIARRGSRVFGSDTRTGMSVAAIAKSGTVKRISKRFSNSGCKPPESFNALYMKHLSLAQARQLSSTRAIEDVAVEDLDDEAIWNN
ncbi:Voltage-gated ion channel, partial [Globisporangium splendens]